MSHAKIAAIVAFRGAKVAPGSSISRNFRGAKGDDERKGTVKLRRAAVLVCVLVILLIVGLLISQTLQTLLLVRHGDEQRQSLRQARELLELGELVLRQNAGKLPAAELTVSLVDTEPADRSELDTAGSKSENPDDAPRHQASLAFEQVDKPDGAHGQVRITVIYRPGTSAEITATQIVTNKE